MKNKKNYQIIIAVLIISAIIVVAVMLNGSGPQNAMETVTPQQTNSGNAGE